MTYLRCDNSKSSMKYSYKRFVKKMYNMKNMLYVSNQRKSFTKYAIYGACLFLAATISFSPQVLFKNQNSYTKPIKFKTDLKYILFFNPKENKSLNRTKRSDIFSKTGPLFATGQKLFIKQKCPHINCYITYDNNLLQHMWNFDAIVYDIHVIKHKKIENLNWTRAPYQRYIFRSLESAPTHYICHKSYDNFFNWTWTYRLDSDIPQPFLDIYDTNNSLVGPHTNTSWVLQMKRVERFGHKVKHKHKAVAWIIDDCETKEKYEDFYKDFRRELESYNYTLDIFGCGEKVCPKGALYKCYKMIEKKYFFQLVTEDSIDEDYVTEKLVKSLQLAIIPIVLGGANYSRFLAPGTYLDVQEFDMKKMGAIIDYLMHNKTTYSYFFDWKNHYTYNIRPKNYVCDLCTKLNEVDSDVSEVKKHFRKWWYPNYEDICLRKRLYYKFAKESQATESKS